ARRCVLIWARDHIKNDLPPQRGRSLLFMDHGRVHGEPSRRISNTKNIKNRERIIIYPAVNLPEIIIERGFDIVNINNTPTVSERNSKIALKN
ncbi:hypothetical protein, partial [Paenibacillus durus]